MKIVFWKDNKYRGVLVDNIIYPYTLLQGYSNGKGFSYGDYPSKERMLKESPELETYEQVDLNTDEAWGKFFG